MSDDDPLSDDHWKLPEDRFDGIFQFGRVMSYLAIFVFCLGIASIWYTNQQEAYVKDPVNGCVATEQVRQHQVYRCKDKEVKIPLDS
ncbi:hypothetical protein D3C78_1659760 [compost metagenome]